MSNSEHQSGKSPLRRWILRVLGWSCLMLLGVWMQMRFNLTEWVVIYENRWFHQEALEVNTSCTEVDPERAIFRLEVDAWVKFSVEPSYTLKVSLPGDLDIINGGDFRPASTGMPRRNEMTLPIDNRRYRDLQQTMVFYLNSTPQTEAGQITVRVLNEEQELQQYTSPMPENCNQTSSTHDSN